MRNQDVYLFSVGPKTPPSLTVRPDELFEVEVRGSLADVEDVREVPVPFTPESEGHPLSPVTGPILVQGAEPGDAVIIDLVQITAHADGVTAILRKFGVLKEEFPEPKALACPVRGGQAWFGGRIPIPISPNLGTIATMPPEGYKPSYAGPHGGDFDQKDVGQGAKVYLPVSYPGALVFFADPHAAIADGIISGTGVECGATVKARIGLAKGRTIERPIVEYPDTIQVMGMGESVEAATADAARAALNLVAAKTSLTREEAYMLLGICGEVRIGTSPRPMMAARVILPRPILDAAGFAGLP